MRSLVLFLALGMTAFSSQMPTSEVLEIYVVDVEGGKASLVVSPSRQSLLIDTGNVGKEATRDAERIVAAIRDAGVRRIDHLVTTHWHRDHVGAMALLADRIPIEDFVDHGASVQPDVEVDAFLQQTYPGLYARSKHTVVKPGDQIPMTDVDIRVVTSAGNAIETPLPGAGARNLYCAGFRQQTLDETENAQSIGIHIAFGRFRVLDLGDLTANKEFELMCPNNRVGTVDLFMASHHGQPGSNFEVLVHAIEPRVAIMNNGTSKGGQPEVMRVIYSSPGLESLWQLHFSRLSGQEYTVPGLFIANRVDEAQTTVPLDPMLPLTSGGAVPPAQAHDGTAYWLKVSAQRDGAFVVTNGRNGFSKAYTARVKTAPSLP